MGRSRNASTHYPIIFGDTVFNCDLKVRPGFTQTFQKLLNLISSFLALFRFNFVIRSVKTYALINPIVVECSFGL